MVISSTGMQNLEISSLNPIKIKPNEEVHLRICVNHLDKGYTIGKKVKSGLIYFGDPWSFARLYSKFALEIYINPILYGHGLVV